MKLLTYRAINNTDIRHAGRDTTAATQGSTVYMYRRVQPAKLLPHTAHSDWINRTGLTSWAFTRWCDRHSSDKVAHYSVYRPGRMKGWVGLGWLVTCRNKVPPPGVEPGHVTHPSTNRARCKVTLLIRPTPLPLRHAASNTIFIEFEWRWFDTKFTRTVAKSRRSLFYVIVPRLCRPALLNSKSSGIYCRHAYWRFFCNVCVNIGCSHCFWSYDFTAE